MSPLSWIASGPALGPRVGPVSVAVCGFGALPATNQEIRCTRRTPMTHIQRTLIPVAFAVFLVGCARSDHNHAEKPTASAPPATADEKEAEIREARSKLSPEDQALVEAQEWCAVDNSERLGEMDVPFKVIVKGQPVFLCCGGCRKEALADPDKTLAKVEELKAKKKTNPPK